MRNIQLSGGIHLSRLAFGCAPVMGRVDRAAALRAMASAFERGVTHFDVARSYGHGEAEAVLGQFAAGRRSQVTIATKFGIRATGTGRRLRWLKPAARRIAGLLPGARAAMRKVSGKTLASGHYGLADARSSFEESLRQLRTDYVDILFIHDCSPADRLGDDLIAWLEGLQREGRIRAWGIATQREWLAPVCAALPVQPAIVQCAQDLRHSGSPVFGGARPAIYHSPYGSSAGISGLRQMLAGMPIPASNRIGRVADTRLLLEAALYMAGDNPVLCSMFEPRHIAENVAAVDQPMLEREQIAQLLEQLDRTTFPGARQ